MATINLKDSLTSILMGIIVLIFFLSTVDIVANEVFDATSNSSNLTDSQKNLIDLIPLIFVVVGIMIAVMILMRFT